MKQKMKQLMGILLSYVMMLGLLPGMSLTAYADGTGAYNDYLVTTDDNKQKSGDDLIALQVTFNEKKWYIIADNSSSVTEGTVTLLAAESFGKYEFHASSNDYSTSTIKSTLDNMTASEGPFEGVKDNIVDTALTDVSVTGAKLYLLSIDEANNVPENVRKFSCNWWLRSPGDDDNLAAFVDGGSGYVDNHGNIVYLEFGVRPALKLNLSSVIFLSDSKTFTPKPYISFIPTGNENETELAGKQVTFNGKPWYIIADDSTATGGTVTLLAAESFGQLTFKSFDSSNSYNSSDVKSHLDSIVAGTAGDGKPNFKDVADAIQKVTLTTYKYGSTEEVAETTDDAKLYLLSVGEADLLPGNVRKFNDSGWWLRSPGDIDNEAAFVDGGSGGVNAYGYIVRRVFGVRPALKLNLSSVIFSSVNLSGGANATPGGGSITQNYFDVGTIRGSMTAVTYTAKSGYKFPETSDYYTTTNGIKVERTSDTVVTVSGAPTNDAVNITVPDVHIHSFTYSASGAAITANCTATGCTLDDGTEQHNHTVKLTLSASDATYTGSAYAGAGLSGTAVWTAAGLTAPTIEYAGRGRTSYVKSTIAPTDAGTYTASITVDTDKTATADFSIAPVALTITGATATDRAYAKDSTAVTISAVTFKDGSEQAVSLTLGANSDYTATGEMSDDDAGDNKEVTATVTLKNANYSLATNTATTTVNISKANARTLADVTATLLYTATFVSESVAGKMPDDAGTLTYSAGEASKTGSVTVSDFAVDNDGSVSSTLSGGASGDTVTLPVTISSTNYADSTAKVVITLTDKATQTITAPDVTVTYGETGKSISAKVTDPAEGFGTISYAVKDGSADYIDVNGSTGVLVIKKVPPDGNNAYVTVTAAETAAYAQATKDVAVTIYKADSAAATVTANNRSCDGTEKPLVTVTGEAAGGDMQYALGTDAATAPADGWETSIPEVADAGTYYVWYRVKGDANHKDTAPVPVEVKVSEKNTPSPTEHGITVTVSGQGTASADRSAAEKDEMITLSAAADNGWHFAKWMAVTPAALDIRDNKFAMPDESVEIEAVFEKDEPGPTPPGPTPPEPEPEPTPDPTPNPAPNPVPAAEAKTVNLGNLTLNGMTLNIKLYAPRNTVSFNGRTHVWIHENVSGKRGKCADLDIAMEGVPDIVAPEFVYGKTKDASEGKAYYYLRLKPDAVSASYNALGEDVKKKLDKEIKKVNKAMKKKANRVYFSIDRLDLGEFAYDASKSGAGKKVFVRKDGSGDTLTLGVKTKNTIDPKTWTVKSSPTTVLDATLSGYSFRIPKREYKKAPGDAAITGKMKNLAGSTV